MKRLLVTLIVLAVLGGLLELGLRAFMPAMIESGARLALRVPQSSAVSVETQGSMLLNAARWRISDVTVTAEDVPLSDDLSAEAKLEIGSMPLFPAFGSLKDGTATFTVPPEQLSGLASFVSRGLAYEGQLEDDGFSVSGEVTDAHFDLPAAGAFAVTYESTLSLDVSEGQLVVSPSEVRVDSSGPVADFLADALREERTVCVADRLPAGVTLTGIDVSKQGDVFLRAQLAEGLLSDASLRSRGSCE